jgi:hypothetical protein
VSTSIPGVIEAQWDAMMAEREWRRMVPRPWKTAEEIDREGIAGLRPFMPPATSMADVVEAGFAANLTHSLLRYSGPHRPQFVHCYECRWPVNPSRAAISLDADVIPATEEQMQGMCDGLRRMA